MAVHMWFNLMFGGQSCNACDNISAACYNYNPNMHAWTAQEYCYVSFKFLFTWQMLFMLNSMPVTCLAYSTSKDFLLAGSEDGMVRVSDLRTRTIVCTFKHTKGFVNDHLLFYVCTRHWFLILHFFRSFFSKIPHEMSGSKLRVSSDVKTTGLTSLNGMNNWLHVRGKLSLY